MSGNLVLVKKKKKTRTTVLPITLMGQQKGAKTYKVRVQTPQIIGLTLTRVIKLIFIFCMFALWNKILLGKKRVSRTKS